MLIFNEQVKIPLNNSLTLMYLTELVMIMPMNELISVDIASELTSVNEAF